jgi:CcmD family protein
MMRGVFVLACVVRLSALLGAQAQPGQGLGEFVPVTQLPSSDQLPAAPYLIAAYMFVWVVTVVYAWSVWRRMDRIAGEMRALAHRS